MQRRQPIPATETVASTKSETGTERAARRAATLERALVFAEHHKIAVFPVDIDENGNKKPCKAARYSNGKKNWGATKDPAQIRRDFAKWPDAMIGAATGAENGFYVVDGDTLKAHGKDGIGNLQKLIDKNSPLETRMARTATGGIHHYFPYPDEGVVSNSTDILADGVDVRGEGAWSLCRAASGAMAGPMHGRTSLILKLRSGWTI
jgi:Bifunctional DNA primase/polymerase, N-terminal